MNARPTSTWASTKASPSPADARPSDLAPLLAPWFRTQARDLPWRHDRTGYRVWISEVMLQQTRVATVIPYFHRFLARFPTLPSLAAADEATVLSLWSGLGYYRRARGLHRGAAEIVERFGGEMPRTVDELLTIRGIGPYTAGAIASLAYDVQAPLVDGNVIRVFARVFGLEDDMRRPAAQQRVWALAREAVPSERPGAFNEALMELGATVCLPREPLCLVCPLAAICVARREDKTRSLPLISKAKAVKEVHAAALLVRDDEGVLLARRRGDALFGGLWEPPMREAESARGACDAILAIAPDAAMAGEITHVLTHRKMFVTVLADTLRPEAQAYPLLGDVYDDARMVAEADLEAYGISTLARKVMGAVGKKAPKAARRSRAVKNRLGLRGARWSGKVRRRRLLSRARLLRQRAPGGRRRARPVRPPFRRAHGGGGAAFQQPLPPVHAARTDGPLGLARRALRRLRGGRAGGLADVLAPRHPRAPQHRPHRHRAVRPGAFVHHGPAAA